MIKLNTFDRLSLNKYVQEHKIPQINDIIIGNEIDPIKLNKLKRTKDKEERFYDITNQSIECVHPHINCLFQTLPIEDDFKQLFHDMIENIFYPMHSELLLLDYQFEYIMRFCLFKF